MDDFKTVEEFYKWIISPEGPGILGRLPYQKSIHTAYGLTAITVYRRGKFQAEILLCHDDKKRYKSLSSDTIRRCVSFMGGELFFDESYFGEDESFEEKFNPLEAENHERGQNLVIEVEDVISFRFGKEGGAFLVTTHYGDNVLNTCLESISVEDNE